MLLIGRTPRLRRGCGRDGAGMGPHSAPKLVTLDLNNVPLREAVKQILAGPTYLSSSWGSCLPSRR